MYESIGQDMIWTKGINFVLEAVSIWLEKRNISILVNTGVHFGIFAIYIFLYINIYLYYLCKYEFIDFYVYQHKI